MLYLFWKMAHSSDVTTDMLEQTLAAHVKILDCSRTPFSGQQKIRWLEECVVELKANEKWVLPALKQIREICSLYQVLIPVSVVLYRIPRYPAGTAGCGAPWSARHPGCRLPQRGDQQAAAESRPRHPHSRQPHPVHGGHPGWRLRRGRHGSRRVQSRRPLQPHRTGTVAQHRGYHHGIEGI